MKTTEIKEKLIIIFLLLLVYLIIITPSINNNCIKYKTETIQAGRRSDCGIRWLGGYKYGCGYGYFSEEIKNVCVEYKK